MTKKYLNGQLVDLTPEEQAAHDADLANPAIAMKAKLQALGSYGLALEQSGVTVNGVRYDTDDATQGKYTAAYNLAQTAMSPTSFTWWMSDGFRSIPKAQILADIPVVAHWVEAVYANIGRHYAAIAALTTVAEIQAYDFTTGWPSGT